MLQSINSSQLKMATKFSLRGLNEQIATSIASLSSYSSYVDLCAMISRMEHRFIYSKEWTLPRLYLLESLGIYQTCISSYYVARNAELDPLLKKKYITAILNAIRLTPKPACFGGQQMKNTLPSLFAAIGLVNDPHEISTIFAFIAREEAALSEYINDCGYSWDNNYLELQLIQLYGSEKNFFVASTVSDPDAYLRLIAKEQLSCAALVVNNVNGYWGDLIVAQQYIKHLYTLDVFPLYLNAHLLISEYIRDRMSWLFACLEHASILYAEYMWNDFFAGLVSCVETLFSLMPKGVFESALIIPDHPLLELFPIVNNLCTGTLNDRPRSAIYLAKHTSNFPYPATLWERKCANNLLLRLDFSLANSTQKVLNVNYMFLSDSRIAFHPYTDQEFCRLGILIWPDSSSYDLGMTCSRCLIVTNGAIHAEDSYFILSDSIISTALRIQSSIETLELIFSVSSFRLRARPGLPAQHQLIYASLPLIVQTKLELGSIYNSLEESVSDCDIAIVFYPTTCLFDILRSDKPVVAVFKSQFDLEQFVSDGSKDSSLRLRYY